MTELYRIIWQLLSVAERRELLFLAALIFVSAIFDLLGVALILPFLTVLSDPAIVDRQPLLAALRSWTEADSSEAFMRTFGWITFCTIIFGIVLRGLTLFRLNRFIRGIIVSLSYRRLAGYLGQQYDWFLSRHSADLGKSVLQEITETVTGSILPAIRILANGMFLIMLIAFLIYVEPAGALMMTATFGIGFLAIQKLMGSRLSQMGQERLRANRARHQVVGEALTGIKELKMLGLEPHYLDRFLKPSRLLARNQARLAIAAELPRYAIEALVFGSMLLFLLWLLRAHDGSLQAILPVVGAFAFAAIRLMPTAQVLFQDVSVSTFGKAGLEDLVLDLKSLERPQIRSDMAIKAPRESIRLQDVSYSYPGATGTAVQALNLSIPVGSHVGISGATGAGKTTVIDLLLGLILPDLGQLLIDDTPLTAANRKAWQARIGFVPQTIHLVDDTLIANIARGVEPAEIDRARTMAAGRAAMLDEVVSELPQGYDTVIGEAGIRLSGGQRQRIGIARALYSNPDLLVLDEATSALDTVTEKAVLAALTAERRTVVMITHRLASLQECEMIYMLENGRCLAEGDYATLMRICPAFAEMAKEP